MKKQVKMLPKQPEIFFKLADGEKGVMEGFQFEWDEWDKTFIDNCLAFDPEIEVVGTPFVSSFLSLVLFLFLPFQSLKFSSPPFLQDYSFQNF